jgi:hypothetical protein
VSPPGIRGEGRRKSAGREKIGQVKERSNLRPRVLDVALKSYRPPHI